MPTKAPADSAQMQRKTAVIDDIKARLDAPTPPCSPSTAGSPSRDIAELRAALRPAATDYKIFKNTLARRAAARRRTRRAGRAARGPGRDRLRPPRRRRRGDRGQGAARLRPDQPEPGAEGRDARAAGADERRRRGPRRRAAPRRSCSPGWPVASRPRWSRPAGLFQAFTRNMAYGVKALIDQRIEAGEALPEPAPEAPGPRSRASRARTSGESDRAR